MKGKSLLWFESSTLDGTDGWPEILAQLRILRQLEEISFFDGRKVYEFFDLIAGSGIGGFAALCLGKVNHHLGKTCKQS